MTNLFNSILTNLSQDITPTSAIITILVSLLFGMIIALTYKKTQDEMYYDSNLAVTLFVLPIILSTIILFIGSNIARAFSLAGTLSIIRFRSAPGTSKDIAYIFFDIASGLACGVGLFAYGALFVLVLCISIIIVEKAHIFEAANPYRILKITIPEDLNYQGAFDDILEKYTKKHTLNKIKTTDLGSLFEIVYRICEKKNINEQEFINDLRTRNGNLTIMISEPAKIVK